MANYVLSERAANAVRGLMAGESSVQTTRRDLGYTVDVREYALPWTVEWAQDENGGDGKWIIWLTDGSFKEAAAVSSGYDGAYATMLAGMTDATKHNGWKIVDDTIQSGTIYLVISDDGAGNVSMNIGSTYSSGDIIIPIATVQRNQELGTHPPVTIIQHLSGEIVYGGSGGSPTPTETIPRHFDIDGGKVVNCEIYCGNTLSTCADYTINPTGGDIWLHVSRVTGGGYNISVDQTFVAETSSSISIKLWHYSAALGKPTLDVRPGIIPVFAV